MIASNLSALTATTGVFLALVGIMENTEWRSDLFQRGQMVPDTGLFNGVFMDYNQFLQDKMHYQDDAGFDPLFMPGFLFDFQKAIVEWAVKKGRCAVFADCGMGKTPIQLVWAQNVVEKTNGNVLILTPLAVGHQTVKEAEKFGIEAKKTGDGKPAAKITVTNYERLHHFDPADFSGVVCDESSILKNFDGSTKAQVTEFMRKLPYRMLCTATAAPNDYIELGTSAEALGVMKHREMLSRFFNHDGGETSKWRLKRHAEKSIFWQWMASWARALRKPSDMGFDDGNFILPELVEKETVIPCSRPLDGKLFVEPARGLQEQREERRATITERCEKAAEILDHDKIAVSWCHLNDEADLLEKITPGAKQVSGQMSDDEKEETFIAFGSGQIRVLVTKPKIGAFGLNWQHCNHMTFFPSHSYEQYYQGVRRCWRFGQKNPVTVDIITTEGELDVLKNLQRKSILADEMFLNLVHHMEKELKIVRKNEYTKKMEVPSWL